MSWKYNCTEFHISLIFHLNHIKKITDLQEDERDKRQRKGFQRLDDPPDYSSKNISWKKQKFSAIKNPEILPQKPEAKELSSELSFDKCQYKSTAPENLLLFPAPICITQKCQLQILLRIIIRWYHAFRHNSLVLPRNIFYYNI